MRQCFETREGRAARERGASTLLAVALIVQVAPLALAGTPVESPEVVYDRTDLSIVAPFPDDYWLVDDATTPTGFRVAIEPPDLPLSTLLTQALIAGTVDLDGFSPIGGIAIELTDAPDPATLPLTPGASLDPTSSIALIDLTAGSDSFGTRVPFQLTARSDQIEGQAVTHAVILHASIPLTPRGRYAVVVTRQLLAVGGAAFGRSAFTDAAMGPEEPGEPPEVTQVRPLLQDVLEGVASASSPIEAADVVFALRVTVRSTDDIPHDLLSVKEQLLAMPLPTWSVTGVSPSALPDVAAVVTGEWEAPDWRVGGVFAHDENGDPVVSGSLTIPFVLALPDAALSGPVPVVMYQHGNPGSAEGEVPFEAASYLAGAGFAVIGFTDTQNRELGQDVAAQFLAIFGGLIATQQLVDYSMHTYAEQLAFLRLIENLGDLDVLPMGAVDGEPELDLEAPLGYSGISYGSAHGQAFLPYAPEVTAGSLVAGALRLSELLLYQDETDPSGTGISFLLEVVPGLFPDLRPPDIWAGLGIFQMIFDRQDPHNHGAFLYANPLEVAGTEKKPSVLLIEGIQDSFTPANSTRSAAWNFGPIPQVAPIAEEVVFLEAEGAPVTANIDKRTTAGFAQYVPVGVPGRDPTPGCESQPEGHYCAQSAPGSRLQRIVFFETAVSNPAPSIIDPFDLVEPLPPPNDACADATLVDVAPFSDAVDISSASADLESEPAASCGDGGLGPTVWYHYTASSDEVLEIDTLGSGFDTVLSVWDAGAGCEKLVRELACNDDESSDSLQSRVDVELAEGEQVFIRVGAFGGGVGGELAIAVAVPEPGSRSLALVAALTLCLLSRLKVREPRGVSA